MPEHTPAPTPARSIYGFFMYLFSKTVLFIYGIWAFTPDYYLHMFNIDYYPLKYWATAIPIQCLVALTIFAFIIYPSSNMMLTPNIDSIHTITDVHANYNCETIKKCPKADYCVCSNANKCYKNNYNLMPDSDESAVPQLQDLDIRFISEQIFFNKKI